MTIKERIDRFCEKYPEPRQYGIELYWNRKDGRHEQVVGGTEPLGRYYGNRIVSRAVGHDIYIQHYRYDAETQLMECSYAVIRGNTPKPNDDRRWKYAERYFLPKEEKMLYDINGNNQRYFIHASYDHYVFNGRKFFQEFSRLIVPPNTFSEAFRELTDGNPVVPPRFEGRALNWPWVLSEWYTCRRKPTSGKITPTQKRLIAALERDHLDIEYVKEKVLAATKDNHYYHGYDAYFDNKANVFRTFSHGNGYFYEKKRTYIDNKGKFVFATADKDGNWKLNGSFTSSQFYSKVVNLEDVYAMPYCSYLKQIDVKSVFDIVSVMRNNEIEQLANMGMTNLAKYFAHKDSIKKAIEKEFGEPLNKKSFCQKYRITKPQLEVVDKYGQQKYYYTVSTLDKMKKIFNTNDVSHMDIDSFERYYKIISTLSWGSERYFMNYHPGKEKLFRKLCNMSEKHPNAFQVFADTHQTLCYIDRANRPDFNIEDFRSYDDLVRMHNTALEIRRLEEAERRRIDALKREERFKEMQKKMAKLDKERSAWNYEEEEFLIRLPNKLAEIPAEGTALHHCVSGYTDNHAQGRTTIMFLRRKSEPDKPFYTIEIGNDNSIRQIHGFGNRWLGNNPEAIPTVARWLRKTGLKCSDQILRCKATGYGATRELVPMPAI